MPEHEQKASVRTKQAPGASRTLRWLAITGLIVAGLGSAAFTLMATTTQEPAAQQKTQPDLGQQLLRTSKFAGLQVKQAPGDAPVIEGRLTDQAQKAELEAWLVKHDYPDARINVALDENLVRDVSEVFRVNGVSAQAQLKAPGEVIALVEEPDAARLAKATEAVRRDVPGLARMTVQNTAKPAPPPTPKVPNDPKKRIVSLVAGKRGYLVTADGSRYFIGAMLPNGHRVARIHNSTITLERDGEQTQLTL